MDSFKLEDGKILVKCEHYMDGIFEDHPELEDNTPEYCTACKDGYQEHKEPEKPNKNLYYGAGWTTAIGQYNYELSNYNEVKRLLEVEKPDGKCTVKHSKDEWCNGCLAAIVEPLMDKYNRAQTSLQELYLKQHNHGRHKE